MAIICKFRIHCDTDGVDEFVLGTVAPTACPTNGAHTVVANSVTVVAADVLVNDGTAKDLPLTEYKQLRYNEIDYKTGILIITGFTYDGEIFSLSDHAQHNWNTLKDQEAEFTWPKDITTLDNNTYELAQANIDTFWTAGKNEVDGHLDTGRVLKKSVFDAVDEAAVDLVIDGR